MMFYMLLVAYLKNKKNWLPEIYQIGVRNPQGMTLSPFDNKVSGLN